MHLEHRPLPLCAIDDASAYNPPPFGYDRSGVSYEQPSVQLRSLKYAELEDTDQAWFLEDLRLGQRNLVVGKNASGKSRTLTIINALARHLAGLQPPTMAGNFDAEFVDENKTLRYQLKYVDEKVVSEKFSVDRRVLLDRSTNGEGTIYAEQIGKDIRFQTPLNQFAAVARRDAIQHSFLEALYVWASAVRIFYFGTSLGKEHLAIIVNREGPKIDDRNQNAVVGLYRNAQSKFGQAFEGALLNDLEGVGYPSDKIGIGPLVSMRVDSTVGEVVGLYVKETDLPGITDQNGMSQGMFRALSLFVHINYCQLAKSASCILVDDIGEGLDFDRSVRLIDSLRRKVEGTDIQLILSTNDRFVMNRVPLEEWSILQRTRNVVRVKNYENSRRAFEEFKFSGLSNFTFLEMDLINEQRPT
jgi:hypothetical protein